MHKKLFATNQGLKLSCVDNPEISRHDVLIEVFSSFFSPGTERAGLENIQKSNLQKALKFRRQIAELIMSGDVRTLLKKAHAQSNVSASTGYSVFGRVIEVGVAVENVQKGQYVVGVGPNANHGAIAIVPKGLVVPVEYNLDFSAAALVGIALNAIEVGGFRAFSRICVLGGGLLGQLVIQMAVKAGFTVDVMDIDPAVEKISIDNGANRYLSDGTFGSVSGIYDGFITTVPMMNSNFWKNVANSAKGYAKVVLVGAADLNVPRHLFYGKKMSFHTAYSYGVGRGDYEFETLNLRAREYNGQHSTLDYLIDKSVDLIRRGTINFDAATKIDMSTDELSSNFSVPSARSGVFFIWRSHTQISPGAIKPSKAPVAEDISRLELDVVGNSAYFRDSHKPALAKIDIPIKKIINRTPLEINLESADSRGNSLLISTPHDEHWPSIEKFSGYKYYLVDKPLLVSRSEYEKYKIGHENIVALMNRRYSHYTNKIEEFISQFDDRLVKLEFMFSVPFKQIGDPIFSKGGRIVGEMCHHLDLAIHLNGEVSEVNSINFDEDQEKWRNERHMLVIKHKNRRTSIIKYWPEKSPFFDKEAILATASDKYLLIKDFSKIETNMKMKKQIVSENDKGCTAMWATLKNAIENKPSQIAEMQKIDWQVYEVLSEVAL